MENRDYWSGNTISSLKLNEIFVFGANPQARHFAGAARAALAFGAKPCNKNRKGGIARGLSGQTYALITKNLEAGAVEEGTGIVYEKEGYGSVSPEQIRTNINELYECARKNPDKKFLITYQYEAWPNGSPKKSLNGYSSQEILEMFIHSAIPDNIIFHDSYKKHLEKALKTKNNAKIEEAIVNKIGAYTFFFHLTSPFSNFHPSKFSYKGFTFISNEQFMMFSKAKTFKDEATAIKIIELNNNPLVKDFIEGKISAKQIVNDKNMSEQWNKVMIQVKGFGREVQNYDDQLWVKKRISVVLFGAREKFSQNDDLKNILMNTGNTKMAEASPYDKIWGIGLSASDAKKIQPEKWPGLNLLGNVLTDLKEYYKNEMNNTSKMKV